MKPTALTIAGSDCSGGAGVQADIKTFTAHKTYGMSVITALTAQNTMGVTSILDIPEEMIQSQLEAVFTDIFPNAVKVGMVSVEKTIRCIAEALQKYKPEFVVVDPVMISTSGCRLLSETAIAALKETLLPLATLITPNRPEAEVLCGFPIRSEEDVMKACHAISCLTEAAILIKGGHSEKDANDYLYMNGEIICFSGERIETDNTHGTGCTLSSAITANLAKGYNLETSISLAKRYITGALKRDLKLGKGNGPLNHFYRIELED